MGRDITQLLEIMRALRQPETGCPWDIEQTFSSIAPYTIEEAYEVADAIDRENYDDLKDELGDLLFQVVYHAQMAEENRYFCFADVVNAINDKLIRRHPHVFGNEKQGDMESLRQAWEKHKKTERENKKQSGTTSSSLLDGLAPTLPALRWAEKIQERAASGGFDWDDKEPVFEKLREEIEELSSEIKLESNQHRIEDELGDVLFSCVNLARHLGINPEQALRHANKKFIHRFQELERLILLDGKTLKGCTLGELEAYWQQAKQDWQ